MTSCFSGGGRAIRLDLDIIKSPSSSWTSNSSSPSSTLSESSNSPLVISTRKPRTPRKRPNQTYNEAAAILSTAYPKIFSANHLSKPCKFTKQQQQQQQQFPFSYEPSELFLPLVQQQHHHHQPALLGKPSQPVSRSWETVSKSQSLELGDDGDFDAESILDEEIEEGIDSIMGNSIDGDQDNTTTQSVPQITAPVPANGKQFLQVGTCYGYPVGLGFGINFDYGFGMRRAIRNPDGEDWWRFASVNVNDITPKFDKSVAVAAAAEKKKKKKKKVEKLVELKNIPDSPLPISSRRCASKVSDGDSDEQPANVGLLLKLNYDNVLKDWSDGHSPFPEDSPAAAEPAGSDVQARLAKIDLFTESGGLREASVQRYKEKRRTRLFSKKIRYQVRKVNADRRPRMKGRFVRRPDSPDSEQGYS